MKKHKSIATTTEELLEELRALVTEAETLVANSASEATDEAIGALRARYEAAQERLLDAYAGAKRKAVAGVESVDEAIRERPYHSLAIAAGAGVLIGLLLAMRRGRNVAAILVMAMVLSAAPGLLAQQGGRYGQSGRNGADTMMLSGTYELETTRGDNPRDAADQATRNTAAPQRDRAYQSLLVRLQSPAMISIDRVGRTVSISSSTAARTSFDADGLTRNEQSANRRTIATRAEVDNSGRIVVTSRGNRNTDFEVTFEPLNDGENMLVTRRMDGEDLRRPVATRSYYRRVDRFPRWDLSTDDTRDIRDTRADARAPRAFTIAQGTRMQAVLGSPINGRTSRSGERFWMTVEGPDEYRDARIEGVIQQVTPSGNGRDNEIRVDFDTLRLRSGETAQFDAVLDTVRTPGGSSIRVESERGAGPSRTEETLQKGAVGAALGAVIGAIAGGGKGAAIGAVVGGAGGAVLAQGRDEYLDLPVGTQVTLIVTSGRIR
jgi:ElaB/YqjD/DUF883 family membrane-anchored ribosome-binding protein